MTHNRPPVSPPLVLAVAISAISAAAPLFRLADGVHPVAAGFWRTAVVGLLLAPTVPRALRRLTLRDGLTSALGGLLLALHFWSWFESLQHTTVLRSTLLVCLTPIWAGLGGWALYKTAPGARFWWGIGLALVGVATMAAGGEPGRGPPSGVPLWGDLLALVGGWLSAAYLLVGQEVRKRVPIGPYGALVTGLCALWLLPVAFAVDAPLTGFSTTAMLALAGLTLGPQLLGHVGMNYVVRYLPAHLVTAAILLEPVGAAILGALVLAEWPTGLEALGGGVVLAGVAVATVPPKTVSSGPS